MKKRMHRTIMVILYLIFILDVLYSIRFQTKIDIIDIGTMLLLVVGDILLTFPQKKKAPHDKKDSQTADG